MHTNIMKIPLPYNSYNIFFILERTLLLESKKNGAATIPTVPSSSSKKKNVHNTARPYHSTGYESVELPPLPPRYEHLKPLLKANWYDPGRKMNEKRKHTKSHGVMSFREMVRTMASNWKAIDPVTKIYVEAVATLLKRRYDEIEGMGGMEGLSVASYAAPPPLKRNWCQPIPMSTTVPPPPQPMLTPTSTPLMQSPGIVTPTATIKPQFSINNQMQDSLWSMPFISPDMSPVSSSSMVGARSSFVSTDSSDINDSREENVSENYCTESPSDLLQMVRFQYCQFLKDA